MGVFVEHLEVRGFRSIREASTDFRGLNLLVGANGAGKSNALMLFRLLRACAAGEGESFARDNGGADGILCGGVACSPEVRVAIRTAGGEHGGWVGSPSGPGGAMRFAESSPPLPAAARAGLVATRIFHFKDLLPRRRLVLEAKVGDHHTLRNDAENLGPFLLWLRDADPGAYERIRSATRVVAPFFDDFVFRVRDGRLRLRWREQGLDIDHGPEALSDGTVRFLCMATLLLQPSKHLPPLVLLDEPELGLHPWAIQVLAELIAGAAAHVQLVVSTQSVSLLNAFSLADVIVVERGEPGSRGGTVLRRPDPASLLGWIDELPLGELWERNLIGGGP